VIDEEFEPGLVGAAAPVRDLRGRVCAAISLSAPKFRLGGRGRMNVVGTTIRTAADESSMLLGEADKIDERDAAGNER
jgi:IclR family transcriptional regulator, KDG regulon repressor